MCPISSAVNYSCLLCPTLPEGTGAEGPCSISSLSVSGDGALHPAGQGTGLLAHTPARCHALPVFCSNIQQANPGCLLSYCTCTEAVKGQNDSCSNWRSVLHSCRQPIGCFIVLYELQESRGRWSRFVPGLDRSVPLASQHILDLQSYSFNSSWVLLRTTPSKHFSIAHNSQALSLLWEHLNIPALGLSVECIHSLLTNTINQMKLNCSREPKVTYMGPQTQSKCPTPSVQQHGDMVLLLTVLVSTVNF